jgi:hypothetical protein
MKLRKKIKTSYAFLIIIALSLGVLSLLWIEKKYYTPRIDEPIKIVRKQARPLSFSKIERPKPKPVSMDRLKRQGCITDGLLSEYNPDREEYISLINRSNCYYLHRAVETWLTPPDFETIDYVMGRITKKDVIYGMFIAEAIKDNADYFNNEENRYFDFKKMCQGGSDNAWGEHTCKPDFGSAEYRSYIKYITRKAIDLGIQSFTFGQIYMQEGGGADRVPEIVRDIRAYAKKKGVNVVIGAQTGTIKNAAYLSLFDYLDGGTGIDADGNLPTGSCLDRWGGCWALLWDETYSKNAKNVLLHLDWSGIMSDDLDIFARMDKETRAKTLQDVYHYFISRNMGFLMPMFGVLDKENGGCYGPKKRFYSPDNKYSCQDEDTINKILLGK